MEHNYIEFMSKTMENYLVTIHSLNKRKGVVKTTELAGLMGYTPASITEMFRKMNDLGFVIYEPYKGVKLTKNGKEFAEKVIVRRRILKGLLVNLGLPCDLAEIECKRLELVMTDRSIGYIHVFLKNKGIKADEWKEHSG